MPSKKQIEEMAEKLIRNEAWMASYVIAALFDNNILDYSDMENLVIEEELDSGEIEEIEQDPLEWYFVTKFLYEQLQKSGAPVMDADEINEYIWGRTTSGQSPADDYVIEEIAERILSR